jgi:hypothetical protein
VSVQSLHARALGADLVVELEEMLAGKRKPDGGPAHPARVKRALLGDSAKLEARGRLSIPLDVAPACWKGIDRKKPLKALAFYQRDEPMGGDERDKGGCTSLNPDYPLIVEAVVNVTYWRRMSVAQTDWKHELEAVAGTKNPYLRYLGARFLLKQAPEAGARLAAAARAPAYRVYSPTLPCLDSPGTPVPSDG